MTQVGVARVTPGERDEILRIHERRTGLDELLLTLDSPDLSDDGRTTLRTAIAEDRVRTDERFEAWWREIASAYRLEAAGHGRWSIDFESCEIAFEPAAGEACPSCRGSDPPGAESRRHAPREGSEA